MAFKGTLPIWAWVALGSFVPAITWGPAYAMLAQSKRQKKWPRIPVRILESGVFESKYKGWTKYNVLVRYSYSYGGLTLESRTVYDDGRIYDSQSDAQAHANRYPVGSQALAWVNPRDPAKAILEPGQSTFLMVALFITGLLWAAFFTCPFWLPLVRKTR